MKAIKKKYRKGAVSSSKGTKRTAMGDQNNFLAELIDSMKELLVEESPKEAKVDRQFF